MKIVGNENHIYLWNFEVVGEREAKVNLCQILKDDSMML